MECTSNWLFQFIEPLDRAGIQYAVVGSVAASVYGEPRATNDVDFVIQIEASNARRLVAAFPSEQQETDQGEQIQKGQACPAVRAERPLWIGRREV